MHGHAFINLRGAAGPRYVGRAGRVAGPEDDLSLPTDATLPLTDEGGRRGARHACLLGLLVGGGRFGSLYRGGAFDGESYHDQ